mgnify:CR=1 FL=1
MAEFAKGVAYHAALIVEPMLPLGAVHQFVLSLGLVFVQPLLQVCFGSATGASQVVHLQRVGL